MVIFVAQALLIALIKVLIIRVIVMVGVEVNQKYHSVENLVLILIKGLENQAFRVFLQDS